MTGIFAEPMSLASSLGEGLNGFAAALFCKFRYTSVMALLFMLQILGVMASKEH